MGKLLDAGIRATLNTDNMMVSGVTLSSEMDQIAAFLTREQLEQLVANSIDAVYADEETKHWLRRMARERIGGNV